MFQHRQVLARLHQGDTEREIARAGLMGRPKAAGTRALGVRGALRTDLSQGAAGPQRDGHLPGAGGSIWIRAALQQRLTLPPRVPHACT